jgi:single-strand DNA-binding protein
MANLSLLSGNLTRDPDIRYLKDGTACCSFGLAVDRRWQDRDSGEWAEATSFFDVACWRVLVSGRLEQRSWTGEDGRLRSRVELVADDVGCSLRFAALEAPPGAELSEPAF